MIQEINFVRMSCWTRTLAIPGFPARVLTPGLTWGTQRCSEFVIGLLLFPVPWASFFCCVCFLQHHVYPTNRTEAEAKCLGIELGSVQTSCVTSDKSFYFGFLYKSRGLDKLIIGCLSTSPCLSLFWVTPPGDITVSCLMAEIHQLPLFLPSGPEVSKGDDKNWPWSLQHTKEFLANGGSSGMEPPSWRILWGQLPLKSYHSGNCTLSPAGLGFCTQLPRLERECLCRLEWWGNRSHVKLRGESHSIADIVSQNPNPLESKLFQLPELESFTTQLVQSLLPGEKHDPLSPRTWVTPTEPRLPDQRASQSCSSETRYRKARPVQSKRGRPSLLIQWKDSIP